MVYFDLPLAGPAVPIPVLLLFLSSTFQFYTSKFGLPFTSLFQLPLYDQQQGREMLSTSAHVRAILLQEQGRATLYSCHSITSHLPSSTSLEDSQPHSSATALQHLDSSIDWYLRQRKVLAIFYGICFLPYVLTNPPFLSHSALLGDLPSSFATFHSWGGI